MKKIFLFLSVFFILVSCKQNGIDNPEISIQELKDHISFLASDSLKGRKPGTPEGKVAANYIKNQFLSFGYKALGEKGFQYFDVITSVVAGPGNSLSSGEFIGKPATDFQPFSFSANATLEADVVFCGFGFDLNKDSLKWEDYNNVDVKGKWVMILRADPELDNEESKFTSTSYHRTIC